MKVLFGCETSGRGREAFRALGHDAWSCDLLPAEDASPHHLQCDVRVAIQERWDLGIFHPTCTRLTNSGVRWLAERDLWEELKEGAALFLDCIRADIPRIAVENPIPHGHAMALIQVPYTQIIQPWNFGEYESKATCLWLKGLPPLRAKYETAEACRYALGLPADAEPRQRIHLMPPGPDRWKERSRSYQGFVNAMAEQWGSYTDLVTEMEAA